ncbi:MAG: hypothetical protein ABWX87_13720 [Pseudoxanthomonas sp.]|jgi:hypothetical protein
MRIATGALLLLIATSAKAVTPASAPVNVVTRLYRDFAWEAVLSGSNDEVALGDQPNAVLLRYFDPNLARLLVDDAHCRARRHEICTLDFAPLWASQDPSAADLSVTQARDPGQVQVQYVVPATREHLTLVFRTVHTASGWRVADIVYPTGPSLVELLCARVD